MKNKYKINCSNEKGFELSVCKIKKQFCEHKTTELSSAVKRIISSDPNGAVIIASYELVKPPIKEYIC